MNSLPYEKRPSIIMIENYHEFEFRLINALCALGVKKEEIIISQVKYIDYEYPLSVLKYNYDQPTWFNFSGLPPMELTIKDKKFAYQNEGRIIVNTKNEQLKNYLLNNVINIGEMSDIAQKFDSYCYEGMKIKVKSNIQPIKKFDKLN